MGDYVAKLLIGKINSNFNSKYYYKNGKQYSYQIILQDNLQQLANFIIDKKKDFDFIIPNVKLKKNDNLKLREKILSMTVKEREKLGINKSTLWYIKPETGLCKAAIDKYYFDWETNSCRSFTWGGCGGVVPYDTLESCRNLCN